MIIITFFLKFFDCALSTIKNVFLIKEKYLLSSICNSLSAMLFIFVADIMANTASEDKWIIALIVFFANLTGSYFPPKFLDKIESDRLFIYIMTADCLENGFALADTLRELNIPVATTIVYNDKLQKTLSVTAYAKTKEQSNIIVYHVNKKYEGHFKYHVVHID
jgi:Na+/melibiose symporter-like transporter